jgi:flagellar hook-length control protein FliK
MIGADLNLKALPVNRDIGSRAKSSDPFLMKTKDPFLTKANDTVSAKSSDTRSADTAPADDSFEATLDNSVTSSKKLNEPAANDVTLQPATNTLPASDDLKTEPRSTMQSIAKLQTATRHAAMQVFLERMQSELGVEPERVVEAFSQLSNDDLMAPPEESSAKFIKLLQLKPEESKKAQGLYNEMLAMVAATGGSQALAKNAMPANVSVTDKEHEEIKMLRSSINDMSDRFFMTGQYHPRPDQKVSASAVTSIYGKNAQAVDGAQQNALLQADGDTAALSNLSAEQRKTLGLEKINSQGQSIDLAQMQNQDAALSSAEVAALANQAAANSATGGVTVAENADDSTETTVKRGFSDSITKSLNPTVSPHATPSPTNSAATEKATVAPAATTAGAINTMGEKPSAHGGAGGDSDKNDKSNEDINNGQFQPQDNTIKNHQTGKTFNLEAAKAPSHAENQANIKELISQAQFLSKRGGGEMKVSLNPEGLGEVNLKVRMQNGQVNVEMVASNEEAKKALEKGLSDLKQTLATHKISLESVRVDAPKDISNQLSQQRQDLERGFQQRFLSDFQERNGSSRREMFEYPGPSVPTNQRHDAASNSYVAKRRDSSRRLDLVA